MKFTTVPKIAEEARPWATTQVIGPPPGAEDVIGSLEAQIDRESFPGAITFRAFVELEDGDLEKIQAGAPIEFAVIHPYMVPVSVAVWNAPTSETQPENVTTYSDATTGEKIEDRDTSPVILDPEATPANNVLTEEGQARYGTQEEG